jgi:hypothetical protein
MKKLNRVLSLVTLLSIILSNVCMPSARKIAGIANKENTSPASLKSANNTPPANEESSDSSLKQRLRRLFHGLGKLTLGITLEIMKDHIGGLFAAVLLFIALPYISMPSAKKITDIANKENTSSASLESANNTPSADEESSDSSLQQKSVQVPDSGSTDPGTQNEHSLNPAVISYSLDLLDYLKKSAHLQGVYITEVCIDGFLSWMLTLNIVPGALTMPVVGVILASKLLAKVNILQQIILFLQNRHLFF